MPVFSEEAPAMVNGLQMWRDGEPVAVFPAWHVRNRSRNS
jgi:hypothetical protein